MPKEKPQYPKRELKPEDLKYYVCLFKIEGHETYRATLSDTVEKCEKHLKIGLGGIKVTEKKFFEIDRLTGSFEEF